MNTIAKKDLSLGMAVRVVQKNHQRTGELTEGIIGRFLTHMVLKSCWKMDVLVEYRKSSNNS